MESNGNNGAEMTAGVRLANAVAAAFQTVETASPKLPCRRAIQWAAEHTCASDEARSAVANQIAGFARAAAEFIEGGDFAGLQIRTREFYARVTQVAEITPPRPALMPGYELFRDAGWTGAERAGLETILLRGMCGVKKGDSVAAIDENGATLASGKSFSRAAILAANVPANQVGR